MNDDSKFVPLFIKERTDRTPDYVLASFSFKVNKMRSWLDEIELQANDGWINYDVKLGKTGNKYAQLNTYSKTARQSTQSTERNVNTDSDTQVVQQENEPYNGPSLEDINNLPF